MSQIDPFKIDSPTCISFSGGRTSAYMLWRVLQSNGGLPKEAIVSFANTGKEEEATLRFVRDCSVNWGVPIVWIEFEYNADKDKQFRIVDFDSAARNGEPFAEMIDQNGKPFLPNPVMRLCTIRLKIEPFWRYMKSLGYTDWDNMVGIRADEARRVAKIRNNPSDGKKGIERTMPLADAGVTKEMVGQFWREQSFDLGLPNNNGVTMHGNCDLCFLKSGSQILSLIAEKPQRAIWWAQMEGNVASKVGGTFADNARFRKDRPSYASMLKFTQEQRVLFDPEEPSIECFCGD